MFNLCTSLSECQSLLPATVLTESCYDEMFSHTAIKTAPVLPATEAVTGCYNNMFTSCSNLSYVKAMFLNTPISNASASTFTYNWLYGVQSSGTFVKNSKATWDLTADWAVPSGWTVESADE